jgi:hypothetical protein
VIIETFRCFRRLSAATGALGLLCLCFVTTASAQATAWEEIPLTGANPGPRFAHTLTDVDGTIYLFGGAGSTDFTTQFNDLWRYDPAARSFVKVEPANAPPPARHAHVAAAAEGKLFVLFGLNRQRGVLNDIWSFDPATNLWQQRPSLPGDRRTDSKTNLIPGTPPGRIYTSITSVTGLGDPPPVLFIVFAGIDDAGEPVGDTWAYSVREGVWVNVSEFSEAVYGHSNSFFEVAFGGRNRDESRGQESGRIVAFGGLDFDGVKDGVFSLDPFTEGAEWTPSTFAGDAPSGRGLMASASFDSTMYVAGGEGPGLQRLPDAFALSVQDDTLTWSRLPTLPVPLSEAAMAAELVSASEGGRGGKPGVRLLLYGGRAGNGQPLGRLFSLLVREPQAPVPGPDLTGAWATLTQKCNAAGRKCKLKGAFDVRNDGDLDAPASTVAFYLSNDATLDSGDTRLRQTSVRGLGVEEAVRVSLQKVKLAASGSGKFVIAVVDDDGAVDERDEANNAIVFGPIP